MPIPKRNVRKPVSETDQEGDGEGNSRRAFFEGAGKGAGLAALLGIFPASLLAEIKTDSANPDKSPRPAGKRDVRVIRHDEFDVPGGREFITEWEISGANGVTSRSRSYGFRIEHGPNYTVVTDTTVSFYGIGEAPIGRSKWVKQQRSFVFGVRGKVEGSVRNDDVHVTTVYDDGRVYRVHREATPVKIDTKPLNGTAMIEENLKKLVQKRARVL